MGLLGCVACGFPFTSLYLCNEAYINKIGLFTSILGLGLLESSSRINSWDLIMWALVYRLNVAFELVCKDSWSTESQDSQGFKVECKDAWLTEIQDP